jgi:hypothetical protein
MKTKVTSWAIALSLIASGRALAGDHDTCPPPEARFCKRFRPVGGWHPYGGGLLHWWPRGCFPRCGGPDDYCRKPPPKVCWPPYPPYYIWPLPEPGHQRGNEF